MNKTEAHRILSEHLAPFGQRTHAQLVPLVESDHVETLEAQGPTGTRYQLEIQFFWDSCPGGTIRVFGSIDDGGFRAFVPLSECLLISQPESLKT